MAQYTQEVADRLDYVMDWEDWLQGDTIAGVVWTIPAGLTKLSDSFGPVTTTVWLTGGQNGQSYIIACRVTTALGRSRERTFRLRVQES